MADEGEKWECPVCMFENLPTNRGTCEFCGAGVSSTASFLGGIASPQNSHVPLLVGKFSNMQTGHSHFSPSSAMVVYGGRVRGCR